MYTSVHLDVSQENISFELTFYLWSEISVAFQPTM